PYVEVALQALPSPDYIPGPEEPEQAPPSPDYSPEYVQESDFEAHPKDDDDEDPEEDPVDYPADGGDDGDDEEESSEDDKDDDIDVEADEEEEKEEEHPAPADSIVVASTAADQAPSMEETEPFETDESTATPPPHPAYRITARISIPAPVPMPAWTDSEVVRLLAISSPPALPLSPWSSPPPQIHREIMRDPEREVGYGITDSWDEIVETLQGAPVSTDTELGGYVREFETRVRQDMDEIYIRLDDEQTERHLLAGRLNMLFRDRHQETINATSVTNAQLQAMIDQGVTAALAARDALRSTNGDDSHNFEIGVRRIEQANRECTYTDFLKCQPLPFKGTEGTVGHEAAYGMTWKMLIKMMTEKYYPQNEIRILEMELWDLKNTGRVYTAASGEKKQYGGSRPYALNAIITTTVHVLLSAATATKLAILHVTVGVRQIPIMLTIRGALGWARDLHVMSVEFKDILKENVPR
nr:hypothetical protein [Tanacetum cinerariifolium]